MVNKTKQENAPVQVTQENINLTHVTEAPQTVQTQQLQQNVEQTQQKQLEQEQLPGQKSEIGQAAEEKKVDEKAAKKNLIKIRSKIRRYMPPAYEKAPVEAPQEEQPLTAKSIKAKVKQIAEWNSDFDYLLEDKGKLFTNKNGIINTKKAMTAFLLAQSDSMDYPKFTNAELKKQQPLKVHYEADFTVTEKEVQETEKRLGLFNDSELEKLPLRKRAGYQRLMRKYSKARSQQAKEYHRVDVFKSRVTDIRKLAENKDLSKSQKATLKEYLDNVGDLQEKDLYEYDNKNLKTAEQDLQNTIDEFAEWRVENDVLLTAGDKRWKERKAFLESFDDKQLSHKTVKVTFGNETREISIISEFLEEAGELELTAQSEKDLDTICSDLQKVNEHMKDAMATRAYMDSKSQTDRKLEGTIKLEFEAHVNVHYRQAIDIFNSCFTPEAPEVKTKTAIRRMKEFEAARDYIGAAEYIADVFKKSFTDPAYEVAIRLYTSEFCRDINDMKKIKDEETPHEDYLISLADQLALLNVKRRFEAGKKMADFEVRIRSGQIPGGELLSDKQVKKAAHDAVHNGEDGLSYNAAFLAFQAVVQNVKFGTSKQSNRASEVIIGHSEAIMDEIIKQEMEKDPTLTEKKARSYLKRAESRENELHDGYVVKAYWKEGDPLFSSVPDEVSKVKNSDPGSLYEQKAILENNIKKAQNYEKEAAETVKLYKQLFNEVEKLGIDLRTAPPEFMKLYQSFDNAQRVGRDFAFERNGSTIISQGMDSRRIKFLFADVKNSISAFRTANYKPSGKQKAKYAALEEILSRAVDITADQEARYVDIHKTYNKASNLTIVDDQKSIEIIERELALREGKKYEPKPEIKSMYPKTMDSIHFDFRADFMNIFNIAVNMKISNSKVYGGSSEFDGALEGAFLLYEKSRSISEALINGTVEDAVKAMSGSVPLFEDISKRCQAYISRKKRQGKSDKKGDEKSKQRYSYVLELEEKLAKIRKNVDQFLAENDTKEKDTQARSKFLERFSEEIKDRRERMARGEEKPVEKLDPVAEKYKTAREEFDAENFDTINELREDLEKIKEKAAEFDDTIRDMKNRWASEDEIKKVRREKDKALSPLKAAYKEKVKSKNIFDYGVSVDHTTLKLEDYPDDKKEQYIAVLKKHGCRIGRTKAAMQAFRSAYWVLDDIAADYVWRPGVEQEIKDAYEWLVQYYSVRDNTLERSDVSRKEKKKLKTPKHKLDLKDMDLIVKEYEKQPYGTNNCFACAGAEMYRQFCRKEGRLSNAVTQFDIRKYRPAFKSFEDYKKEIEDLDPVVDREVYNRYVKETNSYLKGSSVGNIFELGDYFISKQKDAVLKKVTFNIPPAGKDMTTAQKNDRKLNYQNTKAAFLDKVFEGLSGGHVVTVLTQHPMRHYRTIVGIDGEKIKYVDSYGSGAGSLQVAKVGDAFLPQDDAGQGVELVWMEKAQMDDLQKDYKNLAKNGEGGNTNIEPTVEEISMVAQTKGVTVTKRSQDMKYEVEGMRECVYLSK